MAEKESSKKRRHIRAAQAWLEKAEGSLAQNQDVQGDLKLMLAKAELAQAGDSPALVRWRRLGGRWGALAVACVLACAMAYFFKPDGAAGAEPQVLPVAKTEQALAATQQASLEALPAPAAEKETAEPQDLAGSFGTAEPGSPIAAAGPHMTYQLEPEPAEKIESEETVEEKAVVINDQQIVQNDFQVPDVQTQRLMQDAVQALRR